MEEENPSFLQNAAALHAPSLDMLREQLRPESLSGRRRPASAYAAKTSMQFATDARFQESDWLHRRHIEQLKPLKQRRLIQVQLHLQQQQFLSRHPRAARHSPWCRTLHTGPTCTPSASPAAGTQRDSSGHFRPAGTFLIHCAPRPLNYLLPVQALRGTKTTAA